MCLPHPYYSKDIQPLYLLNRIPDLKAGFVKHHQIKSSGIVGVTVLCRWAAIRYFNETNVPSLCPLFTVNQLTNLVASISGEVSPDGRKVMINPAKSGCAIEFVAATLLIFGPVVLKGADANHCSQAVLRDKPVVSFKWQQP